MASTLPLHGRSPVSTTGISTYLTGTGSNPVALGLECVGVNG